MVGQQPLGRTLPVRTTGIVSARMDEQGGLVIDSPRGIFGYRRSGYYYSTLAAGSLSIIPGVPVQYQLGAMPFIVESSQDWDQIAFNCTAGQAGKNAIVGVYLDEGNNYPTKRLLTSGNVSVVAAALKTTAIAFSMSPGMYWLAFTTDGTTVAVTYHADNLLTVLGYTSALGSAVGWSVAQGSLLMPDPFPGGASATVTFVPWVALRAA